MYEILIQGLMHALRLAKLLDFYTYKNVSKLA